MSQAAAKQEQEQRWAALPKLVRNLNKAVKKIRQHQMQCSLRALQKLALQEGEAAPAERVARAKTKPVL